MKVAFISEYFLPFAPGGAEWSSYYLAKSLNEKAMDVCIITPDYGERFSGDKELKIFRFPFYKKLKMGEKLSEVAHLNPFWILWTTFFIFTISLRERVDVLHIQGKYSIIPARLANILLRKKIVITIRDYQVICNYGFCLYEKDRACSALEFLLKDFSYYFRNYVQEKNFSSFIKNLITGLGGRMGSMVIRKASQNTKVIVLSEAQSKIFRANGFKNVKVIGNSLDFRERYSPKWIKKQIVFAGRLTPGKGAGLLLEILPFWDEYFPKYQLIFAGKGFFYDQLAKLSRRNKNISVLGQIDHSALLKLFAASTATITPSIWQEPFGRIPLESLSQGTPAIVTNRGGLKEIVKDRVWGRVVEPTGDELIKALRDVISNNQKYRKNIKKDLPKITQKFGKDITNKYLKIYKFL